MRRLALAAATTVLAYAAVIALLWWNQEVLLFQPQALPANYRFNVGADVQETWINVPGARLNALHLQSPIPMACCSSCMATAATWSTGLSMSVSTAA